VPPIVPNLWFENQAEEAAEHYVSVFPRSRVLDVNRYPDVHPERGGEVLTVDFELDGQRFTALNGGLHDTFNDAISLLVECADQGELDRIWERLTDGGQEVQCGWLKDRYGVSWQVVPRGMAEVLGDPDPERAERAMQAMLGMKKLDLEALRAAADGQPA
jgi:predicted 3-demethylubiquinone-9 3-methyltransferase (glyoxalase superfamily)